MWNSQVSLPNMLYIQGGDRLQDILCDLKSPLLTSLQVETGMLPKEMAGNRQFLCLLILFVPNEYT